MELATAIRTALITFRYRPSELLPFYILGMAAPAIVRVLTFIGIFATAGYLIGTGRLEAFREELAAIEAPPDPETHPEAFLEWLEGFQPLVETVVTPVSITLLVVTAIVTIIGIVILLGVVAAGRIGACFATLRGESGLTGGIAGIRQHWRAFVGLFILEIALWIILSTGLGVVTVFAFLLSPILGIFAAIFALLFFGIGAILIRAIFAFAPVTIVVNETSAVGSIRPTIGFIRGEFMNAVAYYVISIGILVAFGGVSSTLVFFGASSITPLVSLLLIIPALELFKTTLVGSYREALDPIKPPEVGPLDQIRAGLRRGIKEMAQFVRAAPDYLAISIGLFAIGIVMGWIAAGPFEGYIETSIRRRSAAIVPPSAAIDLFGNNWTVALSTAYSGVAAGIPAAVSLWFNGFAIGGIARLEVVLEELIAFVIPHGIIEIPAILIAGALGLHLGVVTWRAWRGRMTREAFGDELGRAFWVLVGVGVLLAIAAVIEAFVSPFYWRPLL